MTVKIKYDRHGAVKSIRGNIGRTRANRAALELWKGNVEPTAWYKLRRFIRRAFELLMIRAEAAYAYHMDIHHNAHEVPVIGLLEDSNE